MKKFLVFAILLTALFTITSLASADPNTVFSDEELIAFAESKAMITAEMSSLKDIFDDIALVYPYISDDKEKTYQMLNDFINRKEYFFGLFICNNERVITDLAMNWNKRKLGMDLSWFDYSEDLFKEKPSTVMTIKKPSITKPSIGKATKVYYNDLPMILISTPLHQEGKKIGWSVMFIDTFAFGAHISSATVGQDINIGILDQAGIMVYDSDIGEVGRSALDDSMYDDFDDLRELLRTDLLINRSGTGAYDFYSSGMGSTIKKHMMWETIDVFDKEYRIFINSERKTDGKQTLKTDFSQDDMTIYKKDMASVKRLFSNIENGINDSIEIYLKKGSADEAFSASLLDIYTNSPFVRHLYFVNKENMMIEAAHPVYEAGISWETFRKMIGKLPELNDKAVYFNTFDLYSDYPGIANKAIGFSVPVMEEGVLKGWIVGVVKIYEMASIFLDVSEAGVNTNYMLINEDGTTLFEADIFEVGKNLYTDPIYTKSIELKTFIKDRLLTETSGSGEYEFYGAGMSKPVNKKIVWNSFEFFDSRFIFSMNLE